MHTIGDTTYYSYWYKNRNIFVMWKRSKRHNFHKQIIGIFKMKDNEAAKPPYPLPIHLQLFVQTGLFGLPQSIEGIRPQRKGY